MNYLIRLLWVAVLIFSVQGCAIGPRSTASEDLSQILIPVKDSLVSVDKKPITFPATVGILMVPSRNTLMVPNSTLWLAAAELKKELLKNDSFINGVLIISTSDIRDKISLDTIRSMYGVDILAVLSYEQDQRSTRNSFATLMDLAIIPAFIVPSIKLTTSTVVDGKIVHIPSNAIVFRASGLDERSIFSTPASTQDGQPNEESIRGLATAVSDFGNNVSKILEGLEDFDYSSAVSMNDVIDQEPSEVGTRGGATRNDNWEKVDRYKRAGGASIGLIELLALIMVAVGLSLRSRLKA